VVKNGLGQSLERRPQNCEPARLSPRLMTSTPPEALRSSGRSASTRRKRDDCWAT